MPCHAETGMRVNVTLHSCFVLVVCVFIANLSRHSHQAFLVRKWEFQVSREHALRCVDQRATSGICLAPLHIIWFSTPTRFRFECYSATRIIILYPPRLGSTERGLDLSTRQTIMTFDSTFYRFLIILIAHLIYIYLPHVSNLPALVSSHVE